MNAESARESSREDLLLPRVARGDPAAVQECLDRYGPLVWSLVRRSLRDHALAEDTVQEIFIAVWRAAPRYDPALSSESIYITTIARRRLIDRFRSRMSRPEPEDLDEVVVPLPDEGLERLETRDEAQLAHEALESLKPAQRDLIRMSVVEGMTHNEIATSTGIPLGTVKSQIRRGLSRVRELLRGRQLSTASEARS